MSHDFYRYFLVGGFAALVDFGCFLLLEQTLPFHYLIDATISFFIATLVNYVLCIYFVFQHPQKYSSAKRLGLTFLVSGIGMMIHHFCLFASFEWLLLPVSFSKITAMGIAFVWNYLSRKHFVFAPANTVVDQP